MVEITPTELDALRTEIVELKAKVAKLEAENRRLDDALTEERPWRIIAADAKKALERGDIALAERLATVAENYKKARRAITGDDLNPLIRAVYSRFEHGMTGERFVELYNRARVSGLDVLEACEVLAEVLRANEAAR